MKVNSFGCLILTTSVRHRFLLLDQCVEQLDDIYSDFDQKVISVDVYESGWESSQEYIDYLHKFREAGWTVVVGQHSGRSSLMFNMLRGMEAMKTEMVMYVEDKGWPLVVPPREHIDQLVHDHKVGWITYMQDIGKLAHPKHIGGDQREIQEYIRDPDNYIMFEGSSNDGLVYLPKSWKRHGVHEYFVKFPIAIVNKKMFIDLLEGAMTVYHGLNPQTVEVETGLTRMWRLYNYDEMCTMVILSFKPTRFDNLEWGNRLAFSPVRRAQHDEVNLDGVEGKGHPQRWSYMF